MPFNLQIHGFETLFYAFAAYDAAEMASADRMNGSTIAALVLSAAAGDESAFNRLVNGLGGVVWHVIHLHGVSASDADDVAQGVWFRLAQHLPRIREPEKLPGWLATTARRECVVVSRRSARALPHELQADALRDAAPDLSEASELRERRQAVREAFAVLDPRCRELLGLLTIDPALQYSDIAETMGMPIASIGPTRIRCIEKLRRTRPIRRLMATDESPVSAPTSLPLNQQGGAGA